MQDINGYERFIGLLPGCYSMGVSHPETFVAGANLVLNSAEAPLTALTVYGHSTQDGTPSPDNPVPIVSAGDSGEIEAKVYGGNLISSDISSWKKGGWSVFNDTVLQLSDGIKIKAINGWIKVYYDTSEMNGKTLNLSFDYRQIESETTSPSTSNAFAIVVQNENAYPTTADDFPFQINSPETVKTHVSVSFIARNYLCFFLRVNTEGLEAGETRAIEVTNIMLNAGNTELIYEPYKTPQSIVLSTPNGLPGIPVTSGGNYTDADGQQWVCDEIDLARGKYVQRVGTETINGGYNLSETPDFPGRFLQHNAGFTNSYKNGGYKSVCNIALWHGWGVGKDDTAWVFAVSPPGYYLNPPTASGITTADELNAFLNSLGFPLVLAGQLETPIETDLPAEEIAAYKALHTYSPATTVSNDADAWMKVGYYGLTTIQKLEKEAIVINGGKS